MAMKSLEHRLHALLLPVRINITAHDSKEHILIDSATHWFHMEQNTGAKSAMN